MTDNSSLEAELRTAQKELLRLESELSNSKQMYENIFEGAGDSILIIDFETDKILDCNTNAARRLGYTKPELLGMEHDDIEQVDLNAVSTPFQYESLTSGTYVYESHYLHKDGYKIPVEVSSRLVSMGNRQVFMNFVRNISLRKEYEKRKIEYTLEHERSDMLKQFIQNAGHEFRTPLSIIKTSIYLMSKSNVPELQHKHTEKIGMQVDRISDFVDIMLYVTKIETEGFALDTLINVTDILKIICEKMRMKYGNSPRLQLQATTKLPLVKGNAEYFPMALEQIIGNAYQFTPEGKSIMVTAQAMDNTIHIDIENEGDGIPTEDLDDIFKLFWRADKSQTTVGFGLGLPIAKKIINLHGGKIDVSSVVGQSARFSILLPAITL